MDKKIGIVGLGVMGSGMAANFLKKGYTVFVWNRSPSASQKMQARGASVCNSPKELAERSDVVFEITANDESSRSVWTDKNGILAGAGAAKILVASGTFTHTWIDELIALNREKGCTFLDIPVTGGRHGAETGELTLLCGGDKKVVESLQPVFDAIAKKTYYFGSTGSGIRYKLILNFMQALHVVGFGQAMRLAKNHGMDLETVADALVERPGGVITAQARERYFEHPDTVNFRAEWILKDLTYAKQFAESTDTSLLDDLYDVFKKYVEDGHGGEDWMHVNNL